MATPTAVVTDIEGTTTRISFVHDVLFPYARARLPDFLAARVAEPEIAAVLAEVRDLAPGAPELATLLAWMDADAKITPLKTLQGLIWGEGYKSGALHGELYADVAPSLRAWWVGGVRLYVYSSGSEAAQKLLFRHTQEGDLTGLFTGFFDTRVGVKREPASYASIAAAAALPGAEMLFLSDVGAELDAAAAAGWRTCQLLRPQDATVPARGHRQAATFDQVAALFDLPWASA
jgi:enolase-phosphatase E1